MTAARTLALVLLVLLGVACAPRDSGPARVPPGHVAIPAGPPPATLELVHACDQSHEPFGRGGYSWDRTVDPAVGRVHKRMVTHPDTPPVPGQAPVDKDETIELTAAQQATLRAALDRVLRGGPYRAVSAVPEGITCDLTIRARGTTAPWFAIDRASGNGNDAIDQLINAF